MPFVVLSIISCTQVTPTPFKSIVEQPAVNKENENIQDTRHKDLPVELFAGTGESIIKNGIALQSAFLSPGEMCEDPTSNSIFILEKNSVRKLTSDGIISTIAGSKLAGYKDGNVLEAQFNNLSGCAVDSNGIIYLNDNGNNRIRMISKENIVTTFAGSGENKREDGKLLEASFQSLFKISISKRGNLYVSDSHYIRKISQNKVETLNDHQDKYTPQREFIGSYEGKHLSSVHIGMIFDLFVDDQEYIYLSDITFGGLHVITPELNVYSQKGPAKYDFAYWIVPLDILYSSQTNEILIIEKELYALPFDKNKNMFGEPYSITGLNDPTGLDGLYSFKENEYHAVLTSKNEVLISDVNNRQIRKVVL